MEYAKLWTVDDPGHQFDWQFAGNLGGGIYNTGTLTVQDSEVTGNSALLGDDLYNLGLLEVIDSVIGEMFP